MPAKPRTTRPAIAVDVIVEAGKWPGRRSLKALAEKAIGAAADAVAPRLSEPAELAVVFTDDRHIRALNRTYRHKDAATNVLSFPAAAPKAGGYGRLLGDIVLASETVRGESEARGLTLANHATHLIVHGFLHLFGYDHTDEHEAVAMEALETAILNGLGIADPYAA
jgi:probable rRNA maturation factor